MSWIGLDIGGANIKVAFEDRTAKSIEFPLWKKSSQLPQTLKEVLKPAVDGCKFAVTMSGELADCFETKNQGVEFIVNSLTEVVPAENVFIYQTTGSFVTPAVAIRDWIKTAASNWHALTRYAARFLPDQTGIVIDIGSTTTDVIPVANGTPVSKAKTDVQRLQSSELVYTGVTRTPICSLINSVAIGGISTLLARELFATTLDAHLFVGNIRQSQSGESTADGRPATIRCAVKRLTRMVCADADEIDPTDVRIIAETAISAQETAIREALQTVKKNYPECKKAFLISGTGDWLAKNVLRTNQAKVHFLELAKLESPQINACAPAFAVATLANEAGV